MNELKIFKISWTVLNVWLSFLIWLLMALRNFPVRNNPERNCPERNNPETT